MMLSLRERKILELLYRNGSNYTTTELARLLHISIRTIKSDIARLRQELSKNSGCEIKTKAGYGIWLAYDKKGKGYIECLLSQTDMNQLLTLENRKYYVAIKLLEQDDYVSMESIAESIFISKSTIVNCINELMPVLERHNLTLEKKVKFGIRIDGSERQKRFMKGYAIRKLIAEQSNSVADRLQAFFKDIDLKNIGRIILTAQNKYGFLLADTSYTVMMIQLALTVQRTKKGKHCLGIEQRIKEEEAEKVIGFISEQLKENFGVDLSEGDRDYLEVTYLGAQMILSENKIKGKAGQLKDDGLEKWEAIIEKTDEKYLENLRKDTILIKGLYNHLIAMINRLENNIHLDNPIRQMIKESLVYEVEMAFYIADLISKTYQVALGENEVCDIAMYLAASLERQKMKNRKLRKKVIVVCGSGTGTSLFLEARLRRMFPSIIVKKILPISRLKIEIESDEDFDFIISTIPLSDADENVVCISPMLNEKDVEIIKKALKIGCITRSSSKSKYPHLFSLMNEKISIFKCDCRSRSEVIRLLGSRLAFENYVLDSYIESAFKREQLSSTSIGDNFAVPHAFEGHVKKPGIGILTLKKPIQWGNDQVQIIFMLSLEAKSQSIFRDVFNELAELTKDREIIEQILLADKFSDIDFI